MISAAAKLRPRFWLTSMTAAVAAVIAVVTLVEARWIEVVFGWELDGGSGTAEWGVVAASLLITAVSWRLARADWRRSRPRVA